MAKSPGLRQIAYISNRPAVLAETLTYVRHFMPWVSENWRNLFKWRGIGDFPDGERAKLRSLVQKAHRKGIRVRFWATPELPAMWRELLSAGVDLLNTDDLPGLRKFLQDLPSKQAAR